MVGATYSEGFLFFHGTVLALGIGRYEDWRLGLINSWASCCYSTEVKRRKLVSWSLTSLFSTNTAVSETIEEEVY